jgi:hypothetical protein
MKFLFNLPLDIGRKIWTVGKYLWKHTRIFAIPYWIIFGVPSFVLYIISIGMTSFLGKYLSDKNRYFYEETDMGEEYAPGGPEENYSAF